MSRGRSFAIALALGFALAGSARGEATFVSSRALLARLQPGRRAEVTLRWTPPSPPGAPVRAVRATLALEPPGRALVGVAATGEKVTLRPDGGEWLQPAARQVVRLAPGHAVVAMRWWTMLAAGRGANERRLERRHYRLVLPATPTATADSADVWLDAAGLPARLTLDDGLGGRQDWLLSGWRFAHARGEASFHLHAPPGYETFDMP